VNQHVKPRTAKVFIYQGDDLARLAELRQAAEVARRTVRRAEENGAPLRVGDEAPSAGVEEAAYDAFVEEAAPRAVEVKVRHIGRRRFRDLCLEHPPRKVDVSRTGEDGTVQTVQETHPDDALYDVNVATFGEALLRFVDDDVRTIVAPEFPTSAARQAFLDDELSDGDFDTLWITAYHLNRGMSGDPLSSRYSVGRRSSSETSS
jgi:hypothetical protein